MNAIEERITSVKADPGLITPLGISRTAVREFWESMSLSMYRLKAIADVRAKIIHKMTFTKREISKLESVRVMAKVKPIKAKGIAKTV